MNRPTDHQSRRAPAPGDTVRRPGRAALLLVVALGVLAVAHLAIGLYPPVAYGLGGGLLVSLLIVGLDWLHGSRGPAPDDDRRDRADAGDHAAR